MEEGGTYVATGVMVGGRKWYLRCFRCGVVSFVLFFRSRGVRWIMCMDRSMREDVCFCACIWIEFLIFYLAECFVMGR